MQEFLAGFIGFMIGLLFSVLIAMGDRNDKISMCENYGATSLGNTAIECSIKTKEEG